MGLVFRPLVTRDSRYELTLTLKETIGFKGRLRVTLVDHKERNTHLASKFFFHGKILFRCSIGATRLSVDEFLVSLSTVGVQLSGQCLIGRTEVSDESAIGTEPYGIGDVVAGLWKRCHISARDRSRRHLQHVHIQYCTGMRKRERKHLRSFLIAEKIVKYMTVRSQITRRKTNKSGTEKDYCQLQPIRLLCRFLLLKIILRLLIRRWHCCMLKGDLGVSFSRRAKRSDKPELRSSAGRTSARPSRYSDTLLVAGTAWSNTEERIPRAVSPSAAAHRRPDKALEPARHTCSCLQLNAIHGERHADTYLRNC